MSLSRATAVTITFPLIDSTNRPTRKSSAASIVTQISKDGGSFVNTTNSAAEIATTTGRYSLALTAAEMAAALIHITATATNCDPVDLMYQTLGLTDGIVTGSGSTTTTVTATGQAETATDFWKYAFLRFTTGSLLGQVRQITGYTTGSFTFTNAFTSAPATNDRYVIVNA